MGHHHGVPGESGSWIEWLYRGGRSDGGKKGLVIPVRIPCRVAAYLKQSFQRTVMDKVPRHVGQRAAAEPGR